MSESSIAWVVRLLSASGAAYWVWRTVRRYHHDRLDAQTAMNLKSDQLKLLQRDHANTKDDLAHLRRAQSGNQTDRLIEKGRQARLRTAKSLLDKVIARAIEIRELAIYWGHASETIQAQHKVIDPHEQRKRMREWVTKQLRAALGDSSAARFSSFESERLVGAITVRNASGEEMIKPPITILETMRAEIDYLEHLSNNLSQDQIREDWNDTSYPALWDFLGSPWEDLEKAPKGKSPELPSLAEGRALDADASGDADAQTP